MTGTSVDAIDTALCKISHHDDGFQIDLLAEHYHELPKKLSDLIKNTISGRTTINDISLLNYYLAHVYYDAILEISNRSRIFLTRVDAIGMHGQTVWHDPAGTMATIENIPNTYQAGSGTALAIKTGIPVVHDFRAADIALGGQGAPLAPIFDHYFLKDKERDVIALNIGGIANITYLNKDHTPDNIIAFDTGPGNTLIDIIAKEYFCVDYDKNGHLARKGNIIPNILEELKKDDYVNQKPPKSTGKERYNLNYLNNLLSHENNYNKYDIISTVTEFTCWSIAKNIELFTNSGSIIYISGGGRNNIYLAERLKEYLPEAKFLRIEEKGIPGDIKEAMIFAFLAYLWFAGIPGNLPSATGAKSRTVLGSLSLPENSNHI